ncbi:cysteine hydrolase family protein [Pseudoxanthomonas sp. 22568]|uniref:cysteine hydrolase family protein n=1 Tax=Pseudoxanthomonas TaxID=83618 RepID=UPI001CE03774|nr:MULTISPECIES: isochorismatase family cysteine hydrolase [Pseudoxanthomonas]
MVSRLSTPPAPAALLIIDMINLFDFPGGAALARQARPLARRLQALKQRFHQAGAPVVYVNDNFMHWQADFKELVAICAHPRAPGAEIAERLRPGPEDYYVLKPKHSAFLCTPLALLLAKLGVRRLVLTGIAADACILATAMDAHAREYALEIPRDGVASRTPRLRDLALATLQGAAGIGISRVSRVRP